MSVEHLPPKESNEHVPSERRDAAGKEGAGEHYGKRKRVKRSKLRRYTPHALVWALAAGTLRVVFGSVEAWPSPLQWHVVLGVVGYQVLLGHGTLLIHTMAHQDLYLFPATSKKTLHWVAALLGAACAALGFYCIYSDRDTHFHSLHGKLGLTSLILTGISLVNGTVFYYWQELGISKGNIKFAHTLTGLLGFVASSLCLLYGFNKNTFFKWSSAPAAYALMAICSLSIVFFSLSPVRILLNKFKTREHDEIKEKSGTEKKLA